MPSRPWLKNISLTLDLAMLAIRSSEEESTEIEEMDTSEPNWCWFYLAECGVWHMFEIDPSAACSVTSAQIEQCYNRNQRGIMEFYTAKYTYRLDFSVMRQINVTTGKQRPIKRSLHSATGFRFICDNLALPVPCHWERINTDEPYQLIQLGRDTYEFKEVARLYERTMDHPIKSIQRIQNLDLWEFFCRKKTQLRKVKRTLDIEERMLFHGTGHSNIQAICTFNFDWRLTGSHGDVYGKGSYFARDAKYSSKFCHTTGKHNTTLQRHGLAPPIFASEPPYKTMFLARVLVGEYTVGHPMYCRPPSKDASFTNFYDSCVDDMANPKIYVIFDSNQIYPEYLIEFY
ncbi:protein mono-ADP-ribosyltransferase PARP11-like isoform X1 [Xiphias gladius]|uniref:Poly [ADP-ribose] polymerase n=1 Tax=Seriola lalandi dorsalis TaxID=1841481 RepID=A0A3B4YQ92_SERLL|nr:poly [ADP-ribose] polymerase 11-like isoform X2 [Seriola dumerili]XP_023284914.1 poly [ADP-ribose] polymerase 11-like [Seriola lalandi dorsalis]XP_040002411.1 protein mono-ADP-ribosyltransferase PARP11-like isoform X1 [Xiphias gladius]XP_056224221.1 protein mono-ADP-ribosyltransferase PARP11-like isoform X2 [Seriola aureovittata]